MVLRKQLWLLVGLLLSGPVHAETRSVGYVANLEGDWSQARLLREGLAPRSLRPGETLIAGDIIQVVAPTYVRVETRAGTVMICQATPTGQTCKRNFDRADGSMIPNFSDRVTRMMRWYATQSTDLVTRAGQPLAFRVASGKPQSLAPGSAPIPVHWRGGMPPWTVELRSGQRVLARVETDRRDVVLPSVLLAPGSYTLSLRDGGSQIDRDIAVARAPSLQPEVEKSAVDAVHLALLRAQFLTFVDDGAWRLQVLREMSSLTETSQPLRFLQKAILEDANP